MEEQKFNKKTLNEVRRKHDSRHKDILLKNDSKNRVHSVILLALNAKERH